MPSQVVSPSVTETAFNCPYCGALAAQQWFDVYASPILDEHRRPDIPTKAEKKRILSDPELRPEMKPSFIAHFAKMNRGEPFVERRARAKDVYLEICNLFLSECYNCHRGAVWVHDTLMFPRHRVGPDPNPDLPADIVTDYEEAQDILSRSPRGAAALLRLCVQKLCIVLGEKGKNIDDDIASLVAKGLDPLIQQSLDIVRVIGNEAVHPGVIDLNDDRETATQLFGLVNEIAEEMISRPKRVSALYAKLPAGKREAIERRDAKATAQPPREYADR